MIPSIYCTIWIKQNNKFTGTVANNGDILHAGKELVEHWNSADKINSLLVKGPITEIGESIEKSTIKDYGEHLLFKDLDEFEMTTTANLYQHGSYVYVFDYDTKQWMFGSKMKLKLIDILNR